jgi:hypothetical protein
MGFVSLFMCAPTLEEAQRKADGVTFFEFAIRFYSSGERGAPGSVNLWAEYEQWLQKRKESGKGLPRGATSGLVGDPERLRRRLRKYQESNIDQVILMVQAGHVRHEDICESLELFAREVMPEFLEYEDEHAKWKAGVLDGSVQLEEIPLDDYYLERFQKFNQQMGRGNRTLTGTTAAANANR